MSNVVNFSGGVHENAQKNLADFIHHAKTELTLYDWPKDKWIVTKGAKDVVLLFSKHGATDRKSVV